MGILTQLPSLSWASFVFIVDNEYLLFTEECCSWVSGSIISNPLVHFLSGLCYSQFMSRDTNLQRLVAMLEYLVIKLTCIYFIFPRATKLYRGSLIALCISNVFFMLPWQFAQFVLLTQVRRLQFQMELRSVWLIMWTHLCKMTELRYCIILSPKMFFS